MLVLPSLASAEYAASLKTAVYSVLNDGGLWTECIAMDVALNMFLHNSAAACTQFFFATAPPVFLITAADPAVFVRDVCEKLEAKVRRCFGARASCTLECAQRPLAGLYEVTVFTCVVATFQYGVQGASRRDRATTDCSLVLKDKNQGAVEVWVRVLPFADWAVHGAAALRSTGFSGLYARALHESVGLPPAPPSVRSVRSLQSLRPAPLTPLTCQTRVSEVSVPSETDTLTDRLNSALAHICVLQHTLTERERSDETCREGACRGDAPAPPESPLPSVDDGRLRCIKRTSRKLLQLLRTPWKRKEGDNKPLLPGGPSKAALYDYANEHGVSLVGKLQGIVLRLAGVVRSLAERGMCRQPKHRTTAWVSALAGERSEDDTASSLFTRAFRTVIALPGQEERVHTQRLEPEYLAAVERTRMRCAPLMEMFRQTHVPPCTSSHEVFQTVFSSCMALATAHFSQWTDDPAIAARMSQYLKDPGTVADLRQYITGFADVMQFASDAAMDEIKRCSFLSLVETLKEIVGHHESELACLSLSVIVEIIPTVVPLLTHVRDAIAWVDELAGRSSDVPLTAFAGGCSVRGVHPALKLFL